MKIIISLTLLAIAAAVSGCTTTNETFDCPPGSGVGCKSLSYVNQGIENGTILKEENTELSANKIVTPVVSTAPVNNGQLSEIMLSDNSIIHRAKEEHLRVWVAPHQDGEGNFHEGSVVHTVVKPSYWHMQQVKG